jgi:hypothetical protein
LNINELNGAEAIGGNIAKEMPTKKGGNNETRKNATPTSSIHQFKPSITVQDKPSPPKGETEKGVMDDELQYW